MARNRQPVLKKCRALGIDPVVLGVNKSSKKRTKTKMQIKSLQSMQFN